MDIKDIRKVNMKIGIITYWSSSDNYGQQLQCFALQNYLKGLGHDAYLIKYKPTIHISIWRKIASFIKYHIFTSSAQNVVDCSVKNENQKKTRDFVGFREKYISSTDVVYNNINELRKNPPNADVYICGSDQVWNNRLEDKNTAGWFLNFGSSKTKRLSYAASIGRELDIKEHKIFVKYLKQFDAISVREQKANVLCHQLGFKKSIIAIDPTLLLDSSCYSVLNNSITNQKISSKPYAFIYLLNIRNASEIYWEEFHKIITGDGLAIRVVASSGYLPAKEFLLGYENYPATIPEWLSLIRHSEYVITTSFHGVVFCLLYHKPFYAVLLNNEYSKGNDRIISLLVNVGLESRIIKSSIDIKDVQDSNICWEEVDKRLLSLRKKSIQFLNNEL